MATTPVLTSTAIIAHFNIVHPIHIITFLTIISNTSIKDRFTKTTFSTNFVATIVTRFVTDLITSILQTRVTSHITGQGEISVFSVERGSDRSGRAKSEHFEQQKWR